MKFSLDMLLFFFLQNDLFSVNNHQSFSQSLIFLLYLITALYSNVITSLQPGLMDRIVCILGRGELSNVNNAQLKQGD